MENIGYRDIIKHEFEFRKKTNRAYSLRAYARDLQINPGQLSEILKSRAGLSSEKALSVAKDLGLSEKEALFFQALVNFEHGRSEQIKEKAKSYIETHTYSEGFEQLTLEGFKLISDWTHYGVLSTMEHDAYDGTIDYLEEALGVGYVQIEGCIKNLLKLELIDFDRGKLVLTQKNLKTTNDIASLALKKFHKQHLVKAIKSIDSVDVSLRDVTSMTMAIDKDRLPEAKQMIAKFRREFCRIMEDGKKNETYNLNIQLVPLRENS